MEVMTARNKIEYKRTFVTVPLSALSHRSCFFVHVGDVWVARTIMIWL